MGHVAVLNAFSRAIEQLLDPPFRRVMLQSVGLTFLAYLVTGLAVSYGLHQLPHIPFPYVDAAIAVLSGVGLVLVMTLFFPAVASLFVSLFLDDIAVAVERRYYPERPPGHVLSFGPAILYAIRFTILVLAANLLLLPFYILLWWFPVFYIVVFAVNGYLLGREYFELVAMRHMPPFEARALRRANRGRIFFAGAIFSFLLTLPVLNLFVPILATAAMVHIFQEVSLVS